MSDSGLDAILLAGGRGTRIASLFPELPKPLVPAAGQPFLYWISRWLAASGVTSFTISVGYRAEQIKAWAEHAEHGLGVPVRCVREYTPLGTGGATCLCLEGLRENFLVSNADSMVLADLAPAIARFRNETLDGLIVAVPVPQCDRYGSLEIDDHGMLRGFHEKRSGDGMINAGIYLFRRRLFETVPAGVALSLEREVLPGLLEAGARIGVWSAGNAPFLDIGTPDSVIRATAFIQEASVLLEMLERRKPVCEQAWNVAVR